MNQPHLYKTGNLFDKCWVLSEYQPAAPLSLSPSLGLSIPWEITILKLGQLVTLQWPLSV